MGRLRRGILRFLQRTAPAASRVVLTQRQIFILPTLTGYAFAAALLLMLLVAINYQNSLAYALVFVLASLGLLTALHTWRNLAGLQLRAGTADSCFVGGTAYFPVILSAGRQVRHGIVLQWRDATGQTDVPLAEEASLVLGWPASERGWLHAPRLRVESRFPLGIWVAWSQVALDMQALVYPQPLEGELPAPPAADDSDREEGQREAGAGMDDYHGLEPWQQGDSLRRIDWKAWSRGQGLWVRYFVEQQGSDRLLDYQQLAGSSERRLSVLCFHVLRLTAAGEPFALQLPGQLLGPDSGEGHRNACLAALALFGQATHG